MAFDPSLYRTVTGVGNNVANGSDAAHPAYGVANAHLQRHGIASNYDDGISAPTASTPGSPARPSAREVSNDLFQQVDSSGNPVNTVNSFGLSNFVPVWGQFLAHDMDITQGVLPPNAPPGTVLESENIPVPTGDPQFDPTSAGGKTLPMKRAVYDFDTGTSTTNPREQINQNTSFIDASQVYGSTQAVADSLRTLTGGRLKTDATGLLLPPGNGANFLAGDSRVNENIQLTAMHTLFMREHNRLADQIAAANPTMGDEEIFQRARRFVSAEMESITYNEFLPALLGGNALSTYRGYNAKTDPTVQAPHSVAAFRAIGHTLLSPTVHLIDANGVPTGDVPLAAVFNNPNAFRDAGLDPILKGEASSNAQQFDMKIPNDIRNLLFANQDLPALDLQRDRDHGLGDYNSTRAAYGLPKVSSFAQITRDATVQQKLLSLYGNVNNIDLFVGLLAETPKPGHMMGTLLEKIEVDQFQRTRDGDRFWFENTKQPLSFTRSELRTLENTTLADVISRNAPGATHLQKNVFYYNNVIAGHVTGTSDEGRFNRPRFQPLKGATIQVLDGNSAVVATTKTDSFGNFAISQLLFGTYTEQEIAPPGWTVTTINPASVTVDRPLSVYIVNFTDIPTGSHIANFVN